MLELKQILIYTLFVLVPLLIWLAVLGRAVLRPHREPAELTTAMLGPVP